MNKPGILTQKMQHSRRGMHEAWMREEEPFPSLHVSGFVLRRIETGV